MFAIEGNWKTSDKDGENRLRVKLIGKTSGIHEKDENEQTQVRHAPGRPNQMIPLPQRPPPTTSRDPSIDQPPRRPMAARLSKKGELGYAPPCPLFPCRWRWLPRFSTGGPTRSKSGQFPPSTFRRPHNNATLLPCFFDYRTLGLNSVATFGRLIDGSIGHPPNVTPAPPGRICIVLSCNLQFFVTRWNTQMHVRLIDFVIARITSEWCCCCCCSSPIFRNWKLWSKSFNVQLG